MSKRPARISLPIFVSTISAQPVIQRAEDFFLDWFGSALAGRNAPAIEAIECFAKSMGPATGPSEVLTSRRTTSPLFAALG